jgi:hypothetical protein
MVVCMTSTAIAASGLRKAFGDKTVLDGIDLDVREGTVFSLLGPNGAGKTTAVNVLTTLTKADGGTVRVAGHDVATETRAVRAVIGVTGQFAAVDDLLTGQENPQLMADLHHLRAGEGKRVITSLDAAALVLTGSTRDDENLTLRVPSDGKAKSLRALLGRLDDHSIVDQPQRLTGDAEWFPARRQDPQPLALPEHSIGEHCRHLDHVLTVVQNQQRFPLTDRGDEPVRQLRVWCRAEQSIPEPEPVERRLRHADSHDPQAARTRRARRRGPPIGRL